MAAQEFRLLPVLAGRTGDRNLDTTRPPGHGGRSYCSTSGRRPQVTNDLNSPSRFPDSQAQADR